MNFGFSGEVGFILLLALVLFGPRKLAELSRQAGRFMADFRKASSALQTQIQAEMNKLQEETVEPVKDIAPAVADANAALEDVSLSGALNRFTESITNFSFNNEPLEVKDQREQNS